MRAPVSSLRSLVQLRAGVVGAPFRSRHPGRSSSAPAKRGASPWITRLAYLLPLLLLAALAACDGAGPTAPETSETVVPGRTWREEGTGRPNHQVHAALGSASVR